MEQYSSFAIPYGGRNYTMGRRDAGENIADNGGVKTAYRAFQRLPEAAKDQCIPGLPFSPNQLFWVKNIIETRWDSSVNNIPFPCLLRLFAKPTFFTQFKFFKVSALWADAFYKSKCPSVCLSVRLFTFEVPFNALFAPISRSRMSNIF